MPRIDSARGSGAVADCLRVLPAAAPFPTAEDFTFSCDARTVALAVRFSLQFVEDCFPGGAVELRVPPFGAVQILDAGRGAHRRGTPPAVVETDPVSWLLLASGRLPWGQAIAEHRLYASGVHADLSALFPLDFS